MSTVTESQMPARGYTRDTGLRDANLDAIPEVLQHIDRYRVLGLLAAGGMGEVYAAQDDRLDRPVAIKRVRPDRQGRSLEARLAREAMLNGKVVSPNVVQVYDLLEAAGREHIITEYVDGRTLRDLCAAGPVDLQAGLEILLGIAQGLDAAHRVGVVHRDLKTDNVLIGVDGVPKIADFGIAHAATAPDAASGGTADAPVSGTYRAMSPEQTLGQPTDFRTDLFSFGTLSYEVLAGESPFVGATPAQTVRNIRTVAHRPLAEAVPGVSSDLSELVDALLQKQAALRPAGCNVVITALERALARLAQTRQAAAGTRTSRPGAIVCLRAEPPDGTAEHAAQRLSAWHEAVERAAARCSGSLLYAADLEALVCIGHPLSHTNNGAAAAHFAGQMISEAEHRQTHLRVAAGIDSGALVVTEGPSGLRVAGAPVRGAVALARSAHAGRILATPRVQRRIHQSFSLTPFATASGMIAYEVGAATDPEPFQGSALVGRHDECAALASAVDALARDRHGATIALVGPAGIGKTRLAGEGSSAAEGRLRRLWTRALETERHTAFAPVARLVGGLRELHPEGGIQPTRASIASAVATLEASAPDATAVPDATAALAHLCGVSSEQDEQRLQRHRTHLDRSDFIARAATALLTMIAVQTPTLLVVEDLHFCDHASRQVFERLASATSSTPLLLLATWRPEVTPTPNLGASVTVIPIGPLSDLHAARIVESSRDGVELPARAGRAILANAHGNPLALEELTRTVAEHVRTQGPTSVLDPATVPGTLAESVTARLDRLPAPTLDLARLAAVIGHTVDAALLSTAAGTSADVLAADLLRLRNAAILAPGPRITFRHALTRDVVLASMPDAVRSAHHRTVIAAIEATHPAWAQQHPEVLAFHLEGAARWVEATHAWIAAGELASKAWAAATACQHYESARRLIARDPDAEWTQGLALTVLDKMHPALMTAHGWTAPEIDEVLAQIETLRPDTSEPKPFLIHFMELTGMYVTGMSDAMDHALVHLRALANASVPPQRDELQYLVAMMRGICLVHSGPPDLAAQTLDEAVRLRGALDEHLAHGRPEPRIVPTAYVAWLHLMAGRVEQALQTQLALEQTATGAHDRITAQCYGIAMSLAAHDWDGAVMRAHAAQAWADAGQEMPPQLLHTAQLTDAVMTLYRGARDKALPLQPFQDAVQTMETHYRGWQAGVMRTAAVLYLSVMAQPCLAVVQAAESGELRDAALRAAGDFLARAVTLVDEEHESDAYWAPEVLRQVGELARLQGDDEAAKTAFARAHQSLVRYFGDGEWRGSLLHQRLETSQAGVV